MFPIGRTSRPRAPTRALAAALALGFVSSSLARAADDPPGRGYGFWGALGQGNTGGEAGKLFDDTPGVEFGGFLEHGSFRLGVGAGAHRLRSTGESVYPELSETSLFVQGSFTPWTVGRFRPFVQTRIGLQHVRAQTTRDRSGPAASGWTYELAAGVEADIARTLALDLSLGIRGDQGQAFSLALPAGASVESGTVWTTRVGLAWRPSLGSGAAAGGSFATGPQGAWGVRRNAALATGELLGSLALASTFNEYVHDANYAQVSPRTWLRNLGRGFKYDGDKFDTNHFYHPWNGSLFYSAGRSNGLGFWPSSGMALAGSFLWECCGETLPMSLNDLVATSLGGVAMGEMLHRLGSVVLDNSDTGASRVAREVSVLAFDTVRGVNRALSGDQRRAANPEDPFERRPPQLGAIVGAGARTTEGDSFSDDSDVTQPVLALWVDYGSVFDNARRRPYDSFQLRTEINFTDRVDPVGLMTIRGDVFSKALDERHDSALALVQLFDYVNNRAYEFGGQSLALGLSRRMEAGGFEVELHGDFVGTVLGTVDSRIELAGTAAGGTELRRYDYGPGLGARAEAIVVRGGRPLAVLGYRYHWLHVTNDTPANGGAADHQLQLASLCLNLPLRGRLGLGLDAELFLRRSRHEGNLIRDRDDRISELRAYATWRLGSF